MKILDSIQEVLIGQVRFREIQRNEKNHYISIGLICQRIESPGVYLDSEPSEVSLFFENNQCVSGNRPTL